MQTNKSIGIFYSLLVLKLFILFFITAAVSYLLFVYYRLRVFFFTNSNY